MCGCERTKSSLTILVAGLITAVAFAQIPTPELLDNPDTEFDRIFELNDNLLIAMTGGEPDSCLAVYETGTGQLYQIAKQGLLTIDRDSFLIWDDKIYFAAGPTPSDLELWVSDGTVEGTERIKEICPLEAVGSAPRYLSVWQDTLFFFANDGIHGVELWKSDGTATGTELVADLHSEPVRNGASFPAGALEDCALFRASSAMQEGELWRTDGTAAGTRKVDVPGLVVEATRGGFVPLNGVLYFAGSTDAHGVELWQSDGTVVGTRLVRDLNPGPAHADPSNLVVWGERIIFQAKNAEYGTEAWLTDGTSAGTHILRDIVPGPGSSNPAPFRIDGSHAYFIAETAAHGSEFWVTDGTEAQTRLLHDVYTGPIGSKPYQVTPFGSGVLFAANHPVFGEELWLAERESGDVRLLKDINKGAQSAEPYHLAVIENFVYFEANDGRHGKELWRSDGTPEGTSLLVDITLPEMEPAGRDPRLLTAGPDCLYFICRDTRGLYCLWQTDLSGNYSYDLSELPSSARAEDFLELFPVDSGILVVAANQVRQRELWHVRTDSTSRLLLTLTNASEEYSPPLLIPNGEEILFSADDREAGSELHRLHLSEMTTDRYADINPGPNGSFPNGFRRQGSRIFFTAQTAATGKELFVLQDKSVLLAADIVPGPASSNPRIAMDDDEGVFLVADDGVHGPELWYSGGTPETTYLIHDINPNQDSAAIPPSHVVCVGKTIFLTAHDGLHGIELWKGSRIPGTAEIVADLFIGPASSNPEGLTVLGSQVYFRAELIEKGIELLVTDGTTVGTHLVEDLVPGTESSRPDNLYAAGNHLFYTTTSIRDDYGKLGYEARWLSGDKTVAFAEANPTYPPRFCEWKDTIFFSSTNPYTGTELWRAEIIPGGVVNSRLVSGLLGSAF